MADRDDSISPKKMTTFTRVKVYKSIVSILFLSIYCAIVFHNLVPHIHSETGATEHHHETAHHGHDHNHGHHHVQHENQEESSWINYILGFLGDVQHTDLGEDHFENFTPQSNQLDLATVDLIAVEIDPVYINSTITISQKKSQNHRDHPKILYEQHRACSSPLRGPPSIS